MRKISLIMVFLMLTAPAWAAPWDVEIRVEPNGTDADSFNIVYDVNDGVAVRAIALDIMIGDDINVVEVNDFHVGESNSVTPGYGIFPSNFAAHIDPEDDPVDWGSEDYTPLADSNDYPDDTLVGLDTNGITVELGSLYVGAANAPEDSGLLLEIVCESDAVTKISLALNQIRGGVVLEDPDDPVVVNLVGYEQPQDCMMPGHPDYTNWVYWGKPKCWCYKYQCRGDFNGTSEGPFYVSLADLIEYRKWVGKFEGPPYPPPYLTQEAICADFDRAQEGPFWVSLNDMIIYRLWVGKFEGPPYPPPYLQECDDTYINFWETP